MTTSADTENPYLPANRLKNLMDKSSAIPIDGNTPIKLYFRSGNQMIKLASVYETEEQFEKAFILYTKYITLFLEKITHHPKFKEADPVEKKLVRNKCNEIFPIAEKLKSILKEKYEQEYVKIAEEKVIFFGSFWEFVFFIGGFSITLTFV